MKLFLIEFQRSFFTRIIVSLIVLNCVLKYFGAEGYMLWFTLGMFWMHLLTQYMGFRQMQIQTKFMKDMQQKIAESLLPKN
jgi:hypothetical protein